MGLCNFITLTFKHLQICSKFVAKLFGGFKWITVVCNTD